MTEAYRTPDERFEDLPDFDFEPRYREVQGLRLAHLDVGEGPPVLMLHGEPTWSFIFRKLIPPITEAGFRCVVPDHAGFGRSDKPLDQDWHSLEQHVELTDSLVVDLGLRDATVVCHDWGGPIGLMIALAHPDRFARVVILDTAIDVRETWASEMWVRFREFVEATDDLPVGEIVKATCLHPLPAEVIAAYEAPFPTVASKAATRGLPMSVARADDREAAEATERLCDALRADTRPMLIIWGDSDLILTPVSGQRLASRIGRRVDHLVPDAGHGLPEDQGAVVGKLIADWLSSGG